ncbi:MAG: cytochrome c [Gammaproteobacteria bacterium]
MWTKRYVRLGLLLMALGPAPAAADGNESGEEAGATAFAANCAVCHGSDGRGGGPYAPLLKTAPPDLTTLAARNAGEFPAARIRSVIDGRRIPIAHGTRDMPIWGALWSGGDADDKRVRARIIALVAHLRALQQ